MEPELDAESSGSRSTSTASLYAGLDDETLHQLAKQHNCAHHEITELLLVFSVLDVDGSGAVSVAELMEVIGYVDLTDHGVPGGVGPHGCGTTASSIIMSLRIALELSLH